MKIDKKVQIKLNDSFEDLSRIIEKLKALGFTHNNWDLEKWWHAIFMEGEMSLVIFEDGEMLIANHNDPLFEQYDSVGDFVIDAMIEKQTRTISVRMSKEAVDYVEDLAKKENKGMWVILEEIILNHKRNGLR